VAFWIMLVLERSEGMKVSSPSLEIVQCIYLVRSVISGDCEVRKIDGYELKGVKILIK
jgi:hypothetical protein